MGSLIAPSSFLNTKCAEFNGTNEYMYVDNPSFATDNAGAFCMWITPTTVLTTNGVKSTVAFVPIGSTNAYLFFGQRWNSSAGSANRICVGSQFAGGTLASDTVGTTAVAAATRYSLVVQSNGSAWSIYLNGSLLSLTNWLTLGGANPGTWLGDMPTSSRRLSFGARIGNTSPTAYSDVKLDEAIYVTGRALTGAEVTEWHNSGVSINPHRLSFRTDIASWWRMGDSRDSATTVFDEIGSNDLTLVNMDASNYVNV